MEQGDREDTGGLAGSVQPGECQCANEKARLEVEKLCAEVEEIHARTRGLSAALARSKGVAGLFVTVLSLAAGGTGLYYGYDDFRTRSDNEAERQARQLDFQVSREIIQLSLELSSSDNVKRANAAILLSAYEEHAVPILVANLRTHDGTLAESVVRSLGLILKKRRIRKRPELVITPLGEEARTVFAEELQKGEPDTLAMTYFAGAFGEILAGANDPFVLELLDGLGAEVASAAATVTDATQRARLDILQRKVRGARDAVAGGS